MSNFGNQHTIDEHIRRNATHRTFKIKWKTKTKEGCKFYIKKKYALAQFNEMLTLSPSNYFIKIELFEGEWDILGRTFIEGILIKGNS